MAAFLTAGGLGGAPRCLLCTSRPRHALQATACAHVVTAPPAAAPAPAPAGTWAEGGAGMPLPIHLFQGTSLLAGHLRKLGAFVQAEASARRSLLAVPSWFRAAQVLEVADQAGLQDVAAAMVLCEAIYRASDFGQEQAEVAIQRLQRQLPAAPRLSGVQWSPPQQEQRYVVADTGDALVVAFLGTKHPADHLVNLHLRHARLFPKRHPGTAGSGSGKSTTEASGAAAHGGYLRRAAGIPVEQLYQLARVQGKRLILAGHSLGGAVATLCTVRLLDALPADLHPTVSCIGFAVPPVGNAQLVALSVAYGWRRRITNYTLSEDWVPGLLGLFARPSSSGGSESSPSGSDSCTAGINASPPSGGPAHERVCWGYAPPQHCGSTPGGGPAAAAAA